MSRCSIRMVQGSPSEMDSQTLEDCLDTLPRMKIPRLITKLSSSLIMKSLELRFKMFKEIRIYDFII